MQDQLMVNIVIFTSRSLVVFHELHFLHWQLCHNAQGSF